MSDLSEFYPTPRKIVDKMVYTFQPDKIGAILEPSAGKGDIVDAIVERYKVSMYRWGLEKMDIDTIEINDDLKSVLKGKGYRVVHNDFLTFETYKRYDLIIMNPPFSCGDKHLLKALDMQQRGGQVVCILNAETIKNPCTNTRKDLVNRLSEYDAKIDYIDDAFMGPGVQRKTGVQIALIKVDIPRVSGSSIIIENLKAEQSFSRVEQRKETIVDADPIKMILEQYNFEVKAGLKLIDEYYAMMPYLIKSKSVINLQVDKNDSGSSMRNTFIEQVRAKYWEALFMGDAFMNHFTSDLRREYVNKIHELKHYDFSLYNIMEIKAQIMQTMTKSIEKTILDLFDEFSHKHHWHEETGKNIHYYNGWKTNQAWFINKRVIIPLYGCYSLDYKIKDKLSDVEKIFDYLDGGRSNHIDLYATIEAAKAARQTKKIQLKYFTITVYQKGTCHIEFTNLELLKKFNLFGSQRKGWLPPSYGKANYEDLAPDEKAVVDSFEGEKEYKKVMANKDYYICKTNDLLMIGG